MQTAYRNILIGLVAGGALLSAGSVTIPNSFTAGETAKASEVNDNFTAVKTAVDGNAADITTNANDITTNTEAITHAITGVTAEGGLTGGGESGQVTIKRSNGYVSIDNRDLHRQYADGNNTCILVHAVVDIVWPPKTLAYSYFSQQSMLDDCRADTGVHFPDQSTITGIKCKLMRNAADGTPKVSLARHSYDDGTMALMASIEVDTNDTNIQEIEATEISHAHISNQDYAYSLEFNGGGHTASDDLRIAFYTCVIGYTY
jgi:hypothetical protein